MNLVFIPTLEIIFAVIAFILATGVLYLFVRRKDIPYLAVVKAYGLFVLGNLVLSFFFPIPRVSFLLQVVMLTSITFLIFYISMRVVLHVSWKRSLAMFLVAFVIFLPALNGFADMMMAPFLTTPMFEQEGKEYVQYLSRQFFGEFEASNLYITGAFMMSDAVSNWQINDLYILLTSSRLH